MLGDDDYDDYDDDDDEREYYKAEAYYEKHPEEAEGGGPEECCTCCSHRTDNEAECDEGKSWKLVDKDVYGADIDGRRGVPMYTYKCTRCENETSVISR